ncbi:MAG: hypothetical protein A3I44_03605 [Candidatus Sungbacteria bacterium RIFCSPLOWO2_02_FULL_51_17]|uniref:Transaldolase n=1 Tax=Candidatus Sungbacteria bacterium RIFCSPHIGHO2_02_FULL_51_29 TaxID=1802273 RepID=A0A1G2KRQ1_9BACT|nr:MAG: hypothetical protein A2676_03385 [Candidatus Sungbacteria bacterium RIFCSPHIGHO2_01_FULL_51_22]OHA02118.1 MAG: hypothetical protein A3C16_04885 [Candidatus Sungbacteria bacterium RIFCSPHIGHO2_02_FULL_51_29]OHA07126.1 MAG: hypothetical protein A3B29_02660 [Candidatus Sungbacteria bacterium RIFCSPLOWO2_01_FULL_51_34]OHA10474.1 MAG: hypothetical protein A3I44_03605 [Candidatus Sungbacteria bacterium RIFCSPLOWO2_02_FULL_51_17]
MKLFVDTANLNDIEQTLKRGFVSGITTNPSLLAKEPKGNFLLHAKKIIELIRVHQPGIHLSVEVFSRNADEILQQAREFRGALGYDKLSIKVQIGWDELEAISKLATDGFSVNCTCCMSINQAVMAAGAGAKYVSLFWGRIRDGGSPDAEKQPVLFATKSEAVKEGALTGSDFDPAWVVSETRKLFDASYPGVQIIAGSIRKATDIRDAALAGAHIVTVPPKFFPQMIKHFKTDEVVTQFLKDFENWMK